MTVEPEQHPVDSPFAARTVSARFSWLVIATILVAITGWMYWIVTKFADGNTWFDFGVKSVLFELIFSSWVFAALLILNAIVKIEWIERALEKVVSKLVTVVYLIIAIVIITFVFVSTVVPFLAVFQ